MDEFTEKLKWQRSPNGALGLFKIHSSLTVSLLMFFCFSTICLQIFTDTIQCTSYGLKQNEKAINNYCWSKTTYEIPQIRYTRQHGKPLPNSILNRLTQEKNSKDNTYRSYYKYTWLALLFQAFVCRIPHIIWKYLESKMLRTRTAYMKGPEKMMIMLGYVMKNVKVNY